MVGENILEEDKLAHIFLIKNNMEKLIIYIFTGETCFYLSTFFHYLYISPFTENNTLGIKIIASVLASFILIR